MKRNVIIIAAVLVLMAAAIGVGIYSSGDHTPANPADASGNLAGNLYNGGYFCEYNGEVYYSNLSDNYHLYRIKADKSVVKEEISAVFSLNIYNGYLYYSKNSTKAGNQNFLNGMPYGIYRVNLKSGKTKCLTTSLAPYITLCGNTILFQEYTKTSLYFSRVQTNKKGGVTRISDVGYLTACAEDGYLYYAEQKGNHNIYRYHPESGITEPVYSGNCYQPICIGDTLYFIDAEDGYSLKRIRLSEGEAQIITSEHCINYNTDGVTVYFEVENSPSGAFGLYRCDADGADLVQISNQACKYINMTSDYTYFTFFTDDSAWYRVPTRGDVTVELFEEIR